MDNKIYAQTTYQTPPKEITDLVTAPPTPAISISPSDNWMLMLNRASMPSIEEVAQPELRLAGLRINPRTNGGSRTSYFKDLTLKTIDGKFSYNFEGLPPNARIQGVLWSPKGDNIAFTIEKSNGYELWVADTSTKKVRKLTEPILNRALGPSHTWMANGKNIIYKSTIPNRKSAPQPPNHPSGPIIRDNDGETAAVRTYQDLLKNSYDEDLFVYYTTSQLMKVDIASGESTKLGKSGIIIGFGLSPDNQYFLRTTIEKPFSYLVPYYRFPMKIEVCNIKGKKVKTIEKVPVAENIPTGFDAVRTGRRSVNWRQDAPSTLYWVETQDGGNPKTEVKIRDYLYFLDAPFDSKPIKSIGFKLRFKGITWGRNNLAISRERWWSSRQEIVKTFAPNKPTKAGNVLFDRSYEDKYNAPGAFELVKNKFNRWVLLITDKTKLYLIGTGASPKGNQPFIDKFDIKTKKKKRLWHSKAPFYEYPIAILDAKKLKILIRRESENIPANYYIVNLKKNKFQQITHFKNPYESLKLVKKEFIKYKRADGVELSGKLYLPAGYDKEKDGPLPTLMWAYPKEYKSINAAGQVSDSPYRFIRISTHSPVLWVAMGYAVFDDFAMPIVGEGDTEPNETFVEQLVAGATAAVDTLVEMGVSDKKRLAIGGHSYGAFMTANLLAHSNLFAAGIARSGAYNRTLTPFGFQAEERTFWEASDVYFKMSPFMHADKIKQPLLMLHGEADNNSGTYPMQSERFYTALKGHGATVRLVMLPHESHGYRAEESVLHMLWEMDTWLEKYVKRINE